MKLDKIVPSKTALVVVDMTYDFTDPKGKAFYPMNLDILPKICRTVNRCRQEGMLIVFLRHSYRKGKYDRNLETMRVNSVEGTGGDRLDPSLPLDEEKDYVITKRRYSGFFGTDLDLVLRENGIETVVVVGTKTNCCVRSTVQDAYFNDYRVVVLSDCVGTSSKEINDMHLVEIDKYFGTVMTSEEFFVAATEP